MGLAMTFTLVSHLREQLSQLVRQKNEDEKRREAEKERLILEVCGSDGSHLDSLSFLGRRKANSRHSSHIRGFQDLEGKI